MDKFYLPGLNGIRAIAALIVVIFHIDQFAPLFNIDSIGFGTNGMAAYAVCMFFALSGYLITYLLIIEKEKFRRVELSKFYIRRILRIWPIYYVAILVSLILIHLEVVETDVNVPLTFSLYTLFLPNVAYAFHLEILTIFPLWSVGVEEQFYAFWPILVNKSKNLLKSLIILVIGYIAVLLFLRFLGHKSLFLLWSFASFDSLGLGGIMAYLVYQKHFLTKVIFHPILQVACWLFLFVSVFYQPVSIISFFNASMHSTVYAILIANVSANRNTIIRLENGLLHFFGRISYGMYVYNMLIIAILSYFLKDYMQLVSNYYLQLAILFGLNIGVTIIISYLSFNFFEARFLKLKHNYSNVPSTNVFTELEVDKSNPATIKEAV